MQQHQAPPQWQPSPFAPAPPRKQRSIRAFGMVAAFILTLIFGMSIGHVTEKAPATCVTALNDAETVMRGDVGPAFTVAGDAIRAATSRDLAGLTAATAKLDAARPKLDADIQTYNSDAGACRASH